MSLGPSQGAFERSPLNMTSLEDVDLEALAAYVKARAPQLLNRCALEQAAARLGLLARTGAGWFPSPIGLLLFGDIPQLAGPHWGVVCVRIAGFSLADPVTERVDLEGSIATMLEAILSFVASHSRAAGTDTTTLPAEYGVGALREIAINALIHRDLRSPGKVAVRIFDDRLEVWSPGGPLSQSLDLTEMAREGGVSFARNVLLASHARALGIGEQIGRGLVSARSELAERGQELTVETDSKSVQVTIPSWLATSAIPQHLS